MSTGFYTGYSHGHPAVVAVRIKAYGPVSGCFTPGLRNALSDVEQLRNAWRRVFNDPAESASAENMADWLIEQIRSEYGSGYLIVRDHGLRRGLGRARVRARRTPKKVRAYTWRPGVQW